MVSVLFKNVGQGDSVFIEWAKEDGNHYGIIDCNLVGDQNPILDEIKKRDVKNIDFVISSHLHTDHYSGFAGLLQHCISNSITIKLFLHTFTSDMTNILNLFKMSQKKQRNTDDFIKFYIEAMEKEIFLDCATITHRTEKIYLTDTIYLSFYSPNQNDYDNLSLQRVQYENKRTTNKPDFNTVSTIIEITNSIESIILTSDATKKQFKRINNKITRNVTLVQVPHHGSPTGLEELFWTSINKVEACPSVFSVGECTRDQLPKRDVVEFFENEKFFNCSTNFVYGLEEFYPGFVSSKPKVVKPYSSAFSKVRSSTAKPVIASRFEGDQLFNVL